MEPGSSRMESSHALHWTTVALTRQDRQNESINIELCLFIPCFSARSRHETFVPTLTLNDLLHHTACFHSKVRNIIHRSKLSQQTTRHCSNTSQQFDPSEIRKKVSSRFTRSIVLNSKQTHRYFLFQTFGKAFGRKR